MPNRPRVPRSLLVIMGSSFLLNLAFNLYRAVFTNFAGQELAVSSSAYGLLEGIREVPGLLTILLAALITRLRDERLYAVSASLIGIGIWLYASAHSYTDLVVATLVQSIGFHLWSTVQDAMVLKSAVAGDRARRLGQISSLAAAATLVGMGAVALFSRQTGLRPFFAIAGAVALGGALLALLIKPDLAAPRRPRFVFRRQYRSYYILTLLQGARRHIVLTFAAFALVKLYGTSVQTMALLLTVHSFLSIWTRPLIGQIIDRVGEQRALSLNYAIVTALFIGYALIRQPWVVYGLFILDNVLSGFDIAVSTHAGRIIPHAELSASLATGTTINHIFGVMVPVIGGVLWEWFGPQIPFYMGAAIVLVAMLYSWNLDARTAAALTTNQAAPE
jgi:predicted MFS family arabinose efflux permease